MKVSLSWLYKYLKNQPSLDQISHKLGTLGLVVDKIDVCPHDYSQFTVAKIVEIAPHPQADRLQVCQVDTGFDIIQVVCGAPNARQNLITILAKPGAILPSNNVQLKTTTIRGVESHGMLCSFEELNLPFVQINPGIAELIDVSVGQDLEQIFDFKDPVLTIDVTPNRGDCLSVQGLVRELVASGLCDPCDQILNNAESVTNFRTDFSVTIADQRDLKQACPHYSGRIFKDLKNGPSPLWLQRRLQSVGLRPISTVVDITNYICWLWGRPLHAFDLHQLQGQLTLRWAKKDETFLALDDKTYTLDGSMLVIADQLQVVSLAGIMGGRQSGCTFDTTSVFLESAYFNRQVVAAAGQKLHIHSDARARFERGVDPCCVEDGLKWATELILELCGGQASDIIELKDPAFNINDKVIAFESSTIEAYAGLKISSQECQSILQALDFDCQVDDAGQLRHVCPPSYRHDITLSCDVVEEILRIKGYDCIPDVDLPHKVLNFEFESQAGSRLRRHREWSIRRVLAARGLSEAVTWSFINPDYAQWFGGGQSELVIINPISQDMSTMRPSLLPNLIVAMQRNLARGQPSPALFEVGSVFENTGSSEQKTMISGVRSSQSMTRTWQSQVGVPDAFTVKADMLQVFETCGLNQHHYHITTQDLPSWYHPGRSGKIVTESNVILGYFGELHPTYLKKMDCDDLIFIFEIFLDSIPGIVKYKKPLILSPYQSLNRDLAFIVDDKVQASDIINIIYKVDQHLITDVTVFDCYKGDPLKDFQKSLAFSIRLEPQEKTLTDLEINLLMQKIIADVYQQTGGELRQ